MSLGCQRSPFPGTAIATRPYLLLLLLLSADTVAEGAIAEVLVEIEGKSFTISSTVGDESITIFIHREVVAQNER